MQSKGKFAGSTSGAAMGVQHHQQPSVSGATMLRALVVPGAEVRIEEVPVPTPAGGEALVRSTLVGICGSDTHALAGQHPFLNGPYVPGHEAVGEVVGVGGDVEGLKVGQRVLLKPNVNCGDCANCRAGRTNACGSLAWIGCDPSRALSGAMAHYFIAPSSNLYEVPDSLDDRHAAITECLATPVHAARLAGDLSVAAVAVLGAGTIGLLCVVATVRPGRGPWSLPTWSRERSIVPSEPERPVVYSRTPTGSRRTCERCSRVRQTWSSTASRTRGRSSRASACCAERGPCSWSGCRHGPHQWRSR